MGRTLQQEPLVPGPYIALGFEEPLVFGLKASAPEKRSGMISGLRTRRRRISAVGLLLLSPLNPASPRDSSQFKFFFSWAHYSTSVTSEATQLDFAAKSLDLAICF